MICGLDDWPKRLPRRSPSHGWPASLGVADVPQPPHLGGRASGTSRSVRFPRVGTSAPSAAASARSGEFCRSRDEHAATTVQRDLTPSRFVVCCPNGHIDDFPYFAWVHEGSERAADGHDAQSHAPGATPPRWPTSWSRAAAGAAGTMAGSFGLERPARSRQLLAARGRGCARPDAGLRQAAAHAAAWFVERLVRRPALGALDPALVARSRDTLRRQRHAGRQPRRDRRARSLVGSALRDGVHARTTWCAAIHRCAVPGCDGAAPTDRELRAEEYTALVRGMGAIEAHRPVPLRGGRSLRPRRPELVAQVSRVSRLREVRALRASRGSSRRRTRTDAWLSRPCSDAAHPWLPAIEVLGEGVFVRLDERLLDAWAGSRLRPSRQRLLMRSQASVGGNSLTSGLDVSPRVLLLHSLRARPGRRAVASTPAIPAASLRERVYDDGPGGILVYTATADSAGSLGGLAALSDNGPVLRRPWPTASAGRAGAPPTRSASSRGVRRQRHEPRRLSRLPAAAGDELRAVQSDARPRHPGRAAGTAHRRLFGSFIRYDELPGHVSRACGRLCR